MGIIIYVLSMMLNAFLAFISFVWWLFKQTQVICIKIGLLVCVAYDACAVASISALVMKSKGMENALTNLFDSMLHGKVLFESYKLLAHLMMFLESPGGIWEVIVDIIGAVLICTIGIIIANAVIWWPVMVASIIIQVLINFIMSIRINSTPNNSIEIVAPTTVDTNQGNGIKMTSKREEQEFESSSINQPNQLNQS